jgi:hypothetical protein
MSKVWLRAGLALGLLLTLGLVSSSGQEKKSDKKGDKKSAVKPAPRPAPPQPALPLVPAKPAAAVPLNAQRGLVNEAQMQAWEQAYGQQFRQMLRTELHFMRLVTEPTKQQYEKIAADTEPAVKEAIRSLLVAANTGNAGGQADPRGPIAAVVARSVRDTLSPEQAAKYDKELEERTAARKRAVVLNLVAIMDKHLTLSAEQRDKISEVLTNNWTDSWNQPQMLLMSGQYVPTLPDTKINPILSDGQKLIWRYIPKSNTRFGLNLSMPVVPIENELWDDDPAKKKAAPAGPKAAAEREKADNRS